MPDASQGQDSPTPSGKDNLLNSLKSAGKSVGTTPVKLIGGAFGVGLGGGLALFEALKKRREKPFSFGSLNRYSREGFTLDNGFLIFLGFIIALAFHWVLFTQFNGNWWQALSLWFIYAIFASMMFAHSVLNKTAIKISAIQMGLIVLNPILGMLRLPALSNIWDTILVIFPAWPWAFVIMGRGRFATVLKFTLTIILILLYFQPIMDMINAKDTLSRMNTRIDFNSVFLDQWDNLRDQANNFGKGTKSFGIGLLNIFRGIFDLGPIIEPLNPDKVEGPEQGVKISEFSTTRIASFDAYGNDQEVMYKLDEPVVVQATVEVTTTKPVTLTYECYASKAGSTEKVQGTFKDNKNTAIVTSSGRKVVKCTFPKLDPGRRQIGFAVTYDYTTTGTLDTSFIYEPIFNSRLSSIVEGKSSTQPIEEARIEILNAYGVTDPKKLLPAMVSKNAPVVIKWKGLASPPIPIKDEGSLDFALDWVNNWKGKLIKMNSFSISVPPGIAISSCDPAVSQSSEKDGEKTKYTSTATEIKDRPSCEFTVKDARGENGVLENMDFRERQISVELTYIFRTEEQSLTVVIEEPMVAVASTTTTTSTTPAPTTGGTDPDTSSNPPANPTTPPADTGFTGEFTYQTNSPSEEATKNLIINTAKDMRIPPEYLLAVAYTESGINLHHDPAPTCREGSGCSVGVMQITPATGDPSCEGIDYHTLDGNIKCGAIILKNKCAGQNCLGGGEFYQYQCRPVTYYGWDIAVRLYNGGGCGQTSVYPRQLYYVEIARCYIAQFSKAGAQITECHAP